VAGPKIDSKLWWRRIEDAERLAKTEVDLWVLLENAVDGVYADANVDLADGALTALALGRASRNRLEVNVLGQIWKHYLDIGWDRYPSFRFRDLETTDQGAIEALETLTRKIGEAGGLQKAGRMAMGSSLTRGPFVLWPIVERNTIGSRELAGKAVPPAALVEQVIRGAWDGKIPPGVDCRGVIAALSMVFSEPRILNTLDEPVIDALTRMDTMAKARCMKELKSAHGVGRRSKLSWLALPYYDWFLVDSTVTDYDHAGWVQRKVVLTEGEFQDDETFTDEAKAKIKPMAAPPDRGVPTDTNKSPGNDRAVEEEGRVVLREVWDKVGWQRFFLADTYDGVVSKDSTPLYMGEDGMPLFPDFFPCTFRTPIQRARFTAARVLGKALCEDMWGPQIEYIEFLSAAMRAAKNTIRVSVAGPHVDEATLTEWKNAKDSTCIRMAKNAPADAKPQEQFIPIPTPPAPYDLLQCADVALSTICSMGRVNRATVTGDPIAKTATQEQISVQGAGVAQGDMIRAWEDGTAESALKGLMIFLHSASPQEFESYLGAAALMPRPSPEPPTMDPLTGEMVPAPPLPPIVEVLKGISLIGAQLECRFDASSRNEAVMRLKQLQDSIALANTVRDNTNTPYADPAHLLRIMFKEMDVPWKEWTPSKYEQMAMMAPKPEGGEDGDGEDGDEGGTQGKPQADSRKAGGQRGTPASPGRQSRHRDPENTGSMNGHQVARATAPS